MSVQFGHGHGIIGGKNQPGNYGNGRNEVDVVREILFDVRKILRLEKYKKLDWYQLNLDSKNHEFNVIRYQNIRNDLVYSFHTNAFNGKAYGTETYWCTNNTKTKNASKKMNDAIIKALGTSNRGVKNGMGYLVSDYARPQNANLVLVELFFQDNASDYKKYQANKKKLVEAIAKVIVEDAGGKWSGTGEATEKPKDRAKFSKHIGRNLPQRAIGMFMYPVNTDIGKTNFQYEKKYWRSFNVYPEDKIARSSNDGCRDKITTGGDKRTNYNLDGKETGHKHKKGATLNGTFHKL